MSDIATAGSFALDETKSDPTASPETTKTSIEDLAINTISHAVHRCRAGG